MNIPDDFDPDKAADRAWAEEQLRMPPFTMGTQHEKDFATWGLIKRQNHMRIDHLSPNWRVTDPYAHQADHNHLYGDDVVDDPQGHPQTRLEV